MAGYTKADFDANYSIRIERYLPGGFPNTRPQVTLGYHRGVMKPLIDARWDLIVPHLGITSTDIVVVVGCGFGWGVERLIELTGCTAVGLDISDYVEAAKDTDELTEIEERITAVGLDLADPRAQEIIATYRTPGARSNATIVKEDLMSNESRLAVRQVIGNQLPTHIITEDMIQEFDDAQILAWAAEAEKFGITPIHIISGSGIQTPENVFALTGHLVLLSSTAFVREIT